MIGSISDDTFMLCKTIYISLGIFILILVWNSFRKNKKLNMFDFFSLYFFSSHCLTSSLVLDEVNRGVYFRYLMTSQDRYHLWSALATVFVYLVILLSFKLFRRGKRTYTIKRVVDIYSKKFWLFCAFYLGFLFLCLFLWTLQYGSIFGMFQYASAIRDGAEMNNPLAIFSRFCTAFPLVFFAFLKISIRDFKNRSKRFIPSLLLCIASLFGTIVNLINLDGRGLVIIFILMIVFILFDKRIRRISSPLATFVILIVVLFCTSIGVISSSNNELDDSGVDSEFSGFMVKEFSYVYTNMVNTFYMYDNGIIDGFRIKDNLISIPFSWLPISVKPKDLQNMNQFNTSLYKSTTGQLPVDLVSGSIMTLGWVGLALVPMFYGWLIALTEKLLAGYRDIAFYTIIYYYFGIHRMQSFATFIDLSPILLSMFGSVVYIISAQFICGERKELNE